MPRHHSDFVFWSYLTGAEKLYLQRLFFFSTISGLMRSFISKHDLSLWPYAQRSSQHYGIMVCFYWLLGTQDDNSHLYVYWREETWCVCVCVCGGISIRFLPFLSPCRVPNDCLSLICEVWNPYNAKYTTFKKSPEAALTFARAKIPRIPSHGNAAESLSRSREVKIREWNGFLHRVARAFFLASFSERPYWYFPIPSNWLGAFFIFRVASVLHIDPFCVRLSLTTIDEAIQSYFS